MVICSTFALLEGRNNCFVDTTSSFRLMSTTQNGARLLMHGDGPANIFQGIHTEYRNGKRLREKSLNLCYCYGGAEATLDESTT